jgi:transcriptional regulator with XRE-family HTH domain
MQLDEIKELMVLTGWSRQELADKLGISRNTVDRWFVEPEKQKRYPSAEHVRKMREFMRNVREQKMREWASPAPDKQPA